MLDTIYISKTLPQEIQNLLSENLGKVFGVTSEGEASLYVLDYKDTPKEDFFNIIFVDFSSDIDRHPNCDYFQPFKYKESIYKYNPRLFLNLVEFHIERLKLSPVLYSNHETILACD
jgi:hypothetical protein